MRTIKFSLFSDLHHYPGVFRSQTPEHLWQIQRRAEEEKVDFIIHCGDLTHAPHECQDFVGMYNDFHIPSYHCLGNHDTDGTPLEQTLRLYHMPDGHYYFDQNGFRMIVADPNYYFHGGEYIHYDMGNYYPYGPYRDFMPPDQIDWLKGAIEGAPGPCLIFSHESFEREGNGVQNRALVRQVIHEANQKRPGSVLLCANGHYHRNALTILDNVAYFDVSTFDQYLKMLKTCTEITGCPENYERYGTQVQQQVDQAIARADGSKPSVLYIRASGSSCKVKSSEGSVLGEMLADLDTVNIADSETSLLEQLSMETILAADPDYIFVMDRDAAIGTDGAQLAQDIMENELVQGTDAYKNGQLVYLEHPAVWYTAEGGVQALDLMLQDLENTLLA